MQPPLASDHLLKTKFSKSKTSDKRPSFISNHDPSLAWRFYNRRKRPSDARCGLFVHTPPGCILVSNQLPYATTNSLHFGWSLIRGSSVIMPSNMMHPKWIDSKNFRKGLTLNQWFVTNFSDLWQNDIDYWLKGKLHKWQMTCNSRKFQIFIGFNLVYE